MSTATLQALAQQLDSLTEALQAVQSLLADERRAIAAGQIEAIREFNQRKQDELDAIEAGLQGLLLLVSQCGEAPTLDGLGALLRREAERDRSWRGRQQRLTQALEECQDLNQINGYLAYSGQREATALLGVLIGESGANRDGATYGRHGERATTATRGGTSRKA